MSLPFRWNVARREQLGRLAVGDEAASYPEFLDDLRTCCARVLAQSEDADLVFVGRSPESLFDYLSGMLMETSWRDRLSLLNISVYDIDRPGLRIGAGPDVHVVRQHFAALHLSPQDIATRARGIAFVDLVSTGLTLGKVADALFEWANDERFDVRAVKRRLRFVGITWRRKTSPNTIRWQQNVEWVSAFRPSAIKNVSIPGRMWGYLGNDQDKVARTQPAWMWRDEAWRTWPPHEDRHLAGLRLALRVFDHARSRAERLAFARRLAEEPALSKPWLRSLIAELRKTGAKTRTG